ncbi:MAG: hypothetical protein AAGA35_02285 [Patescibacteria group bacterium]
MSIIRASAFVGLMIAGGCTVQVGTPYGGQVLDLSAGDVLRDIASGDRLITPEESAQSEAPKEAYAVIGFTHDGKGPTRCTLVELNLDDQESSFDDVSIGSGFFKRKDYYFHRLRGVRFFGKFNGSVQELTPLYGDRKLGIVTLTMPDDGVVFIEFSNNRREDFVADEYQSANPPFLSVKAGTEKGMRQPYLRRDRLRDLAYRQYDEKSRTYVYRAKLQVSTQNEPC